MSKRITQLPALTALATAIVPVVQGGATYQTSLSLPIDVLSLGAGTAKTATENATAFQAALDAAGANRSVFVPDGTFALNAKLSITPETAKRLLLSPGTVLDFTSLPAGESLNDAICIEVSGTEGDEVALTADLLKISDVTTHEQACTVPVATTATFSEGQYVLVRSNETYDPGVPGVNDKRGFIGRVLSLTETELTLESPTPFDLLVTDSARVAPLTMVENFSITGGSIIGAGVGSVHNGISLSYCVVPIVHNVTITGTEDVGVGIYYCVGAEISNCKISDCTDPSIVQTGYGVVLGTASVGCRVKQCEFRNCRHAVAGGGTIAVLRCIVEDNTAWDCGIGTQAFDCHEPCFDFKFINNRTYGGNGGFVIRGSGTHVIGNEIRGTGTRGIRVRNFDANPYGLRDVVIADNVIHDCNGVGIFLEGQPDESTSVPIVRVKVLRNRISNVADHGIYAIGLQGAEISDNYVEDLNEDAGTGGNGIRIESIATSPAAGDNTNVRLHRNTINGAPRKGIWVRHSTQVRLVDNDVDGVPASPGQALLVELCDHVQLRGGKYDGSAPSTLTPVQFTDCNNVLADGFTALGNPAAATQDGIRFNSTGGTLNGARVTNAKIGTVGRFAINATETDHVLVSGNDVREGTHATKVNMPDAVVGIAHNNDFFEQVFTVATLPTASLNTNRLVRVSDGDRGGFAFARSNGNTWRTLAPRSTASTTVPTLTIAAGVVSGGTSEEYKIANEGAAPSDDLVTIDSVLAGWEITIYPADDGGTVVVKHGTGNIFLDGQTDFTMQSDKDRLKLRSDGTNLVEVGRGDNGT